MKLHPVLLALLVSGCALTSKSTPADIRYFSPEPAEARTTAAQAEGPRLRLGRIAASADLRSRIVYRASSYELGEYDDLRWSDTPDAYVRRALERALFDQGRARASIGAAPTLDVEVIAFEEVRRPEGRAGAVELAYTLTDGDDVLAKGRTRIERAATSTSIEAVVAAIGAALDAAADAVARAAVTKLSR